MCFFQPKVLTFFFISPRNYMLLYLLKNNALHRGAAMITTAFVMYSLCGEKNKKTT